MRNRCGWDSRAPRLGQPARKEALILALFPEGCRGSLRHLLLEFESINGQLVLIRHDQLLQFPDQALLRRLRSRPLPKAPG